MSRRMDAVAIGDRPHRTFIDAVLAGDAVLSDLDDWVGRWHDSDSDLKLHEWLGLTGEEYARLGAGDHHLAVVLHARRDGTVVQGRQA